jgi:alkanesulfonate monooxygenase SsuD/methylene tetrahydromethanopterin reductase-like flavin-dependent oxidoreductase (luciferase family)
VATGAIVAFARSPMLVAQGAWDLQRLSGGRFELGLGSQVTGNLEGRFGVAWAPPAARMRDYVQALRAVFARWQDGTPLAFESPHYRLTRMQPYFDPGPLEHGFRRSGWAPWARMLAPRRGRRRCVAARPAPIRSRCAVTRPRSPPAPAAPDAARRRSRSRPVP